MERECADSYPEAWHVVSSRYKRLLGDFNSTLARQSTGGQNTRKV